MASFAYRYTASGNTVATLANIFDIRNTSGGQWWVRHYLAYIQVSVRQEATLLSVSVLCLSIFCSHVRLVTCNGEDIKLACVCTFLTHTGGYVNLPVHVASILTPTKGFALQILINGRCGLGCHCK